jgi:large subunit ribosomal protein L21
MPMYAVIRTGGKQYRVKPGDVLVVEKVAGEAGAEVAFKEVLMLGEGAEVVVGAPLVDGGVVKATLVETRKGEKVKIFKKIRRQGYRRTRGHRQTETVLRVTSVAGGGKSESWDGTVDLTPKALLDAKARGLTSLVAALEGRAPAVAEPKAKAAPKKAAAKKEPAKKAEPKPAAEAAPAEAAAPAPKAEAKAETKAKAPAKAKAAAPKAAAPKGPSKTDTRPKAAAKSAPAKPAPKTARPKGKG